MDDVELDVMKGECEISYSNKDRIFGEMRREEVEFLCSLMKILNPNNVFEFGTFRGLTTINMALNLGLGGKVYTLDIGDSSNRASITDDEYYTEEYEVGSFYKDKSIRDKVVQIYGNSLDVDLSIFKSIEFILIDGGHSYDVVINDSKKAFNMVSDSGIIIWHDYSESWEGVMEAIDEIALGRNLLRDVEYRFVIYDKGNNLDDYYE